MQCYKCGYIHFKLAKKCPSCSTLNNPALAPLMVTEESGFTIFEGDPSSINGGQDSDFGMESPMGNVGTVGQDFDLDLSEAHLGNGAGGVALAEEESGSYGESEMGSDSLFQETGIFTDIGPNDFELDLSEAVSQQIMPSHMSVDAGDEEVATSDVEIGEAVDTDNMALFDSGSADEDEIDLSEEALDNYEVEGLGFVSDSGEEVNVEVEGEGDLDLDLNIDSETDDAGDLNLDTEEVSLDEETDLDLSADDDVISEIVAEEDKEGGIEFDLDMGEDDTDEPVLIEDEDNAVETLNEAEDDELSLEIEGLELETPSEDEERKE